MADDVVSPEQIRRSATGLEGEITRDLPQPPQQVWDMLTRPEGLAQWLAPGTVEPRQGGRIHVDFGDSGVVIDSPLLVFDPPRHLAFSWSSGAEPQRPLHWRLAETGEGTRLTLTVSLPAGEDLAKACAGYEAHLEMLAAALEGVPIKFPFPLYQARRKAWQAALEA